jgi:hypothetical protein
MTREKRRLDLREVMKVFADEGYKSWLVDCMKRWMSVVLDIVKKPIEPGGFQVQPK